VYCASSSRLRGDLWNRPGESVPGESARGGISPGEAVVTDEKVTDERTVTDPERRPSEYAQIVRCRWIGLFLANQDGPKVAAGIGSCDHIDRFSSDCDGAPAPLWGVARPSRRRMGPADDMASVA
jgi:hypothetical protein